MFIINIDKYCIEYIKIIIRHFNIIIIIINTFARENKMKKQ